MEYNKNFFDPETIPDYALQPAKPAEEFDAAAYDHLYRALSGEKEDLPAEPEALEDVVLVHGPAPFEMTATAEPVDFPAAKQVGSPTGPESMDPAMGAAETAAAAEPFPSILEAAALDSLPAASASTAPGAETEALPVMEASVQPAVEASVQRAAPSAFDGTAESVFDASAEPAALLSAGTAKPLPKPPALPVFTRKADLEKVRKNIVPVPAPVSATMNTKSPVQIASAANSQTEKILNITDLAKHKPITLHIEEDVLIPDVKPDMKSLLCSEGRCRLAEYGVSAGLSGIETLRITGDLTAQTLYLPESGERRKTPVSLETRIPFREDIPVNASGNSFVALDARIESIGVERINERKFRIKADIGICPREYRSRELRMFNGMEGEPVECRRDSIKLMDVAFRKTETIELSEELKLKEGMPDIDKILCCNARVVENHRQINREKAVVNAAVFLNILYEDQEPVLYQGKTDFTQFIKVDDDNAFTMPLTGSRAAFRISNLSIQPKKDERGDCRIFDINMDVDTTIEYYREIEESAVTDLYHLEKEARYATEALEAKCFYGNSLSEATAREIINIPEQFGGSSRVAYLSGAPEVKRSFAEQGKCIVEGVIPVTLLCLSGEEGGEAFCLKHTLDFRSAMEFPGADPGMEPDTEVSLKELWFDPINSRQIEVNAGIAVSTNLFGQNRFELIQSVSLAEPGQPAGKQPGIIVYVASKGDSAWKVAKRYRTPVQKIKNANDLTEDGEIQAGTKLLIIK